MAIAMAMVMVMVDCGGVRVTAVWGRGSGCIGEKRARVSWRQRRPPRQQVFRPFHHQDLRPWIRRQHTREDAVEARMHLLRHLQAAVEVDALGDVFPPTPFPTSTSTSRSIGGQVSPAAAHVFGPQ